MWFFDKILLIIFEKYFFGYNLEKISEIFENIFKIGETNILLKNFSITVPNFNINLLKINIYIEVPKKSPINKYARIFPLLNSKIEYNRIIPRN